VVGPLKLPVSQVSTYLHTLTCHRFPPNKVQASGAAFRESPRSPPHSKPSKPSSNPSDFLPWWGTPPYSCSCPSLACPPNLPTSGLIGAESWRTQPICLGSWAVWAHPSHPPPCWCASHRRWLDLCPLRTAL
jgi:hypothetical protein